MQPIGREDALVLAHYYVPGEVQAAADYVGDSFALARKAVASDKPVIIFCGVSFMGESAKILCPEKQVILPVADAHCAMADRATEEEIVHMRGTVPDLAVVTYINSSARLKALSDVIVTSSNAVKIEQPHTSESKTCGRQIQNLFSTSAMRSKPLSSVQRSIQSVEQSLRKFINLLASTTSGLVTHNKWHLCSSTTSTRGKGVQHFKALSVQFASFRQLHRTNIGFW